MPKGTPLIAEQLERRRSEIAQTAVHLIIEKGFLETSVREIAAAVGVGKSTLYDYFKTKDDILIYHIAAEVDFLTHQAEVIILQPVGVVEKLRRIMLMHLDFLLQNKATYLKLTVEMQRLNQESVQRIQVKRYAYQDLLRDLVLQGVQEGLFRPVNAQLVSRLLLNSMLPIVFSSRPSGEPQELMEEAFEIFMQGIQK